MTESLDKTTEEEWAVLLGEFVGRLMAHQGVTRPLPNLRAFEEDSKLIVDWVSAQISAAEARGRKEFMATLHESVTNARKAGWETGFRYVMDKIPEGLRLVPVERFKSTTDIKNYILSTLETKEGGKL